MYEANSVSFVCASFFVCRLHTPQAPDSRRNDRRTQNSPGGRTHDTGLSFVNYPGQRFGV